MGILRLLLAISVLCTHIGPVFGTSMLPGGLAVHVFFIVSGFYMSLVLTSKYRDTLVFWTNRLLRLYPTYLLFTILTWIWFVVTWLWLQKPPQYSWIAAYADMRWWQVSLLVVSNWTMLGQEILSSLNYEIGSGFWFPGSAEHGPGVWVGWFLTIRPAWSISVELLFYICVPLLVRLSFFWLSVLALASWWFADFVGSPLDYWLFPSNLRFFVIGMLLHRMLPMWDRMPHPVSLAMLIFAVGLIVGWPAVSQHVPEEFIYFALVPTIPAAFLLTKRVGWDAFMGNLSYPVYLSHLLVGLIVQNTTHSTHPNVVLAATIVISIITCHFVDNPVDRWRQKRASAEASAYSLVSVPT